MTKTTEDIVKQLLCEVRESRTRDNNTPVVNPYSPIAYRISQSIDKGDLSLKDLSKMLDHLAVDGFTSRAKRLKRYLGEQDMAKDLQALLRGVADQADGFAGFKAAVEQELLGFVITAHPTFAYDRKTYQALVEAATNDAPIEGQLNRPEATLDLKAEFEQAGAAIANFQVAFDRFVQSVLEVAAEVYPNDWKNLTPRLVTIASWVGFDLDGRSDITWLTSVWFRFSMAATQLNFYEVRWSLLAEMVPESPARDKVKAALRAMMRFYQGCLDTIPGDAGDLDGVSVFSQKASEGLGPEALSISQLSALVQEVAEGVDDQSLAVRLLVFRARLVAFGFGQSHIHFRLNASQLHNAIRPLVSMEKAPDEASSRRRFIGAVSSLLDNVRPHSISFDQVARERTTAKRLFMLVAQFRRYFPDDIPIRFLIAEADTPFTVLSALYYARLFGVEDSIDISPLFETEIALERGSKIIQELLDNKHYFDYVKSRRRLAIQAGYSDAGRYLGQVAAGLSIERLRMKLIRLMDSYDLADVQLLVFDTGGESVGRGAHPDSINDRLNYYHSPAARALIAKRGMSYKQEFSLQGGDGYLLLGNEAAAHSTLSQALVNSLTPHDADDNDLLYDDTDWSLDFFLKMKEFQSRLTDDPDYLALIASLGPEILYPSGSRMTIRQVEGRAPSPLERLSQIRAIPHNALLQQMGFFSNTVSGMGGAIAGDQETFAQAMDGSQRLGHIMKLVRAAIHLTDEDLLRAYISQFDPQYWIDCLRFEKEVHRHKRIRRLIALLEKLNIHEPLRRMNRVFSEDLIDLKDQLEGYDDVGGYRLDDDERDRYILLHVIRISIMQSLFIRTTRIPRFASHRGTTTEALKLQLLKFQVPGALAQIRDIFPLRALPAATGPNYEDATYDQSSEGGYAWEHENVFDVVEDLFGMTRRISMIISGYTGAMG